MVALESDESDESDGLYHRITAHSILIALALHLHCVSSMCILTEHRLMRQPHTLCWTNLIEKVATVLNGQFKFGSSLLPKFVPSKLEPPTVVLVVADDSIFKLMCNGWQSFAYRIRATERSLKSYSEHLNGIKPRRFKTHKPIKIAPQINTESYFYALLGYHFGG